MRSIGDVVAIHINNRPSVYARIEAIQADLKPGWFQVKLLLLSFPAEEVTWILRQEYLQGAVFTMKDVPIQILPLKIPVSSRPKARMEQETQGADVISLNRVRARKGSLARKGTTDEE